LGALVGAALLAAAPVGKSVRVVAGHLIVSNRIGHDLHAAVDALTITPKRGDPR
jgi:hypothetical protein